MEENLEQSSNEENEISKLGVKLSFLPKFLTKILSEGAKEDMTTAQVKDKFIFEVTKSKKCSYCNFLLDAQSTESEVGIANVFISHAWQYKFAAVVNALMEYFKSENNNEVIVWFDIFSNNQHSSSNRTSDWWCNTFKNAIKDIGKTVMVLTPWKDPAPLHRGWCIWELYCTIETKSKFTVALDSRSEEEFINDIDQDAEAAVKKMLAEVDCEKSDCGLPGDKILIHQAIKDGVGFFALNEKILHTVRSWIIQRYRKELRKRESSVKRDELLILRTMNSLAILYETQGKDQEAKELFRQCYERATEILPISRDMGVENFLKLSLFRYMDNFALQEMKTGNFQRAFELYHDCLSNRKSQIGEYHEDTLNSMNNFGSLYAEFGNFAVAEKLYLECLKHSKYSLFICTVKNNLAYLYATQGKKHDLAKYYSAKSLYLECIEKMKASLGENHLDTLTSMNNLGLWYCEKGEFEKAKTQLKHCFQQYSEKLGRDHPNTLRCQNNLASAFQGVQNFKLAKFLFEDCLKRKKAALGSAHKDTLKTMHDIAYLYRCLRNYDFAEAKYEECLEMMKKQLGVNHQMTQICMNHLISLQNQKLTAMLLGVSNFSAINFQSICY